MTNFRLALEIPSFSKKVHLRDKLFLLGSCFTEHISKQLSANKFALLENPHGILFNPMSIASSMISYIEKRTYQSEDLFYFNELWNSWDHHSRFSHPDQQTALQQINNSQEAAHTFLQQSSWLIITLGSAFVYEWTAAPSPLYPGKNRDTNIVANCHRVPADRFKKRLLAAEEVFAILDNLRYRLMLFNPDIKIIYTISPVRHIRDGLIENNKSKSVLIRSVHHMVEKFENHFYFPSYELVVDDLRDYRFYAEDMVHPNYLATQYVWEKFAVSCIDPSCYALMKEMEKINLALKHRAFNPGSQAHRQFLNSYLSKTKTLQQQYPYLDFSKELQYFGKG